MPMKPRILDDVLLAQLAREHGTPLFVYDASLIRRRIADLAGFDLVRYAQKANSNLAILRLMRAEGVLVDAVSAGEIARALAAGYAPHEIVFTADVFDRAAMEMLALHPCPVNLGSPFMIEQYGRSFPGREITLRVNPGFGHGHAAKVNTGGESSKHGIWHADLARCVASARSFGLRVRGLHAHIGSGSDFENLARMRDTLRTLAPVCGPDLDTLSTGGGLPTPYRAGEEAFDVARFSGLWLATRDVLAQDLGRTVDIEVEPGRYLVAEAGALLTEVRGTKTSGAIDYVFVDAGFHNLVRPAMYGAFHEISVVGRAHEDGASPKVVAGPLCESGDVFTQGPGGALAPRLLPDMREGDLLCIHDAGAYGAAMSSNYNSQPHAAEVLVDGDAARLVRKRQTIEELLQSETEC